MVAVKLANDTSFVAWTKSKDVHARNYFYHTAPDTSAIF